MKFNIEKDKQLGPMTTFGIPAKAMLFAEYSSLKELQAIMATEEYMSNEVFHMGGGSNLLFASDFKGLVLHSAIKGITRYDKDAETVFAIAGAGEKWTDFVDWCISSGLAGVENLAGIPGEVGAAPVQNVGAYGVEAADVIHNVECIDTITRNVVTFKNNECGFGYRDSIFKGEAKGRYIVLRVSFKLKNTTHASNLDYGPLKDLHNRLGHEPTIEEVACEVKKIRDSKLPDPAKIGSAGSFFKNPVVHRYFYKEVMSALYDDIPFYPTDKDDYIKIPAGWLIEQAGLKGAKVGGAQVWQNQSLVIVNTGNATAKDVIELSRKIIDTVREKFGVVLYPEVNTIDTTIHVTILGSGTSKGVPEVGCNCKVCKSDSRYDKRLRASALVETEGLRLLIDVSPDFRQQALSVDLYDLDAALITHSHYDHVGGIDDLRPFCAKGKFPLYMAADVSDDLHRRIDYCLKSSLYPGVPSFDIKIVDNTPFIIKGLKVVPIKVMHGKLPILGYRIGDFAYITDAKTIDEDEKEKLQGLDVLVVNALRDRDHFSHMNLEEALTLIKELNPKRAYLTHLCHEIGLHADLEKRLPENVFPCYDGLKITV